MAQVRTYSENKDKQKVSQMTLLDHFAGLAMTSLIESFNTDVKANGESYWKNQKVNYIAQASYEIAEAMISHRNYHLNKSK